MTTAPPHGEADRLPPRPRVVVMMDPLLTPDLMGAAQWERLAQVAEPLADRVLDDLSLPDAESLLASAEVALTGWGCPQFDTGLLTRMPRLKFVAHTGSSVRPLVSEAFWACGIRISSAAPANARPVAEFALAAILLANKDAFIAREHYRQTGEPPQLPWTMPGRSGNHGAIVGVVGASKTGRMLIELLRPFDFTVLVYDPYADAAAMHALGAEPGSLDELARRSDVVSLHLPLTDETRHLIDARFLAAMTSGATLINTARGGVVDNVSLEKELIAGRINAVLDVTDPEPLQPTSRLLTLPNVFVTPHLAGAAGRETRRLADFGIEEIARFADGRPLTHEVRRESLPKSG